MVEMQGKKADSEGGRKGGTLGIIDVRMERDGEEGCKEGNADKE